MLYLPRPYRRGRHWRIATDIARLMDIEARRWERINLGLRDLGVPLGLGNSPYPQNQTGSHNIGIDYGRIAHTTTLGWNSSTATFTQTFTAAPTFIYSIEVANPDGPVIQYDESYTVGTTSAVVNYYDGTGGRNIIVHWIAIGTG